VIRSGDMFEPTSLSDSAAGRVRGLMQIREAVREVFRTQLDDEPEYEITRARQELNRVYDSFVHKHGYITSRDNFRAFTGDPDHPLLLSLENYDAEKQTATKAAILTRRTLERYQPVEHAETAAEALAISLNETGFIDWNRMASLTGSTVKAMQAELTGQMFETPGGSWETADEYLSGDVRRKLDVARAAADINPANAAPAGPRIKAVKRLNNVIPPSGVTGAGFITLAATLSVVNPALVPGRRL